MLSDMLAFTIKMTQLYSIAQYIYFHSNNHKNTFIKKCVCNFPKLPKKSTSEFENTPLRNEILVTCTFSSHCESPKISEVPITVHDTAAEYHKYYYPKPYTTNGTILMVP